MKKCLVLSGKGGTGKTTVVTALIKLSQTNAFADCDVDAPNLHLLMSVGETPTEKPFIGSKIAKINPDKCIGCGACYGHCRFNAITKDGKVYTVEDTACEGCAVCTIVCPVDAISMNDDISGTLKLYTSESTFSSAKLKMGRGNSGKLVTAVKSELFDHINQNETEVAFIDGSPGIGCPVIASITGTDLILVVAEPTVSGISDMKRIMETAAIFHTKVAVCINKYDVSEKLSQEIETYCLQEQVDFLGKIPYDKRVLSALNEGKSIIDFDTPASNSIRKIYANLMPLLES